MLTLAATLLLSPVSTPVELASTPAPLHGTLLTPEDQTRAAAVIIAHTSGNAAQASINFLALLFLFSRLVYIWLYIKDMATVRSIVWAVGLLCIVALFIAAI